MSDWRNGEDNSWPVRFPSETRPRDAGGPRNASGPRPERTPPRWTGSVSVDTREVQKRLAWLLLAAEIGMALVAACVLPLVFLNLPVQEEGLLRAIGITVGGWLGLSSQVACVVMALPIPILAVTLAANVWWFRRMRKRAKQTEDRDSS